MFSERGGGGEEILLFSLKIDPYRCEKGWFAVLAELCVASPGSKGAQPFIKFVCWLFVLFCFVCFFRGGGEQ